MTEPLTSSDMDVRDLDGFMLNVERLLASELWALTRHNPLAFRGAVGLWARAWKQIPPASLPDNDEVLASYADVSPAQFKKHRDLIMRGFRLCTDGRFYHRRLAEEVNRIFAARNRERRRAELRSSAWAALRSQVFERDNYRCQYCGIQDVPFQCDHIIPASRGGNTTLENLTTACMPCNCSKGALSLDEWNGRA